MTTKTITVFIHPAQVDAQMGKRHTLKLARMVNGLFTVVCQMRGHFGSGLPAYTCKTTFEVASRHYRVNWGMVGDGRRWPSVETGFATNVSLGEAVVFNRTGGVRPLPDRGAPGTITILNQFEGKPAPILFDSLSPIFVDLGGGMGVGETTTLTPMDTYQLWFSPHQREGTLIPKGIDNVGTVTFPPGATDQTISYGAEGQWLAGPLAMEAQVEGQAVGGQVSAHPFAILANFSSRLDGKANEYLRDRLHRDFPSERRPRHQVLIGDGQLWLYFDGSLEIDGPAALAATDATLTRAKADPTSPLRGYKWTLHQTQ